MEGRKETGKEGERLFASENVVLGKIAGALISRTGSFRGNVARLSCSGLLSWCYTQTSFLECSWPWDPHLYRAASTYTPLQTMAIPLAIPNPITHVSKREWEGEGPTEPGW